MCLVADVVGSRQFLYTEVLLATRIELGYLNGRYGMIDAVILTGIALYVERQVDGLAHLALLEQGSIAFARYLDDFILGWTQHHLVFARLGIRTDGQRVAGDIDTCRVLLAGTEVVNIAGRLHRLVVLLANQVRGVVALQLHHNLDGVAQVVLRQTLTQWLAALHVATNHATA